MYWKIGPIASMLAEKPICRFFGFFKTVFGVFRFLKTEVGSVFGFFKTAVSVRVRITDPTLICARVVR